MHVTCYIDESSFVYLSAETMSSRLNLQKGLEKQRETWHNKEDEKYSMKGIKISWNNVKL